MGIASRLRKIVAEAAGVGEDQINLEHPELAEHGDYSTNIALVQKGGRKLAEEIVAKMKVDPAFAESFGEARVAGAGFINIWLRKEYLVEGLQKITDIEAVEQKKVMFEFGQPNTHKLPHIGHLFSYIYGEATCRLLEAVGVMIRRVNYQGDVGLHVAKCLWAYRKSRPDVPALLEDKVKLLQLMYQTGSKAYSDDPEAKKEIDVVNKKIYEGSVVEWEETRSWSVEYYLEFEKRLGIGFDQYYFESQVANTGKVLVENAVGRVFEKSEGAIVYKGGQHTRVFVTSEGNPTYEAKDMALQVKKLKDWSCDLLVITTAHEQNDYFNVVFSALEELEPELKGKLKHIGFGMINLKSGKMASRTGNIIGGVELVDTVVAEAAKLNPDKEIAERVGLGAIKYAFLKNTPTQDMAFDMESSIATEGNSGPYIQYTYARICSVLQKSQKSKVKSQKLNLKLDNYQFNDAELGVLRYLYRFSEVVEEAARRYAPNVVCTFLYEVAQRFNSFYNKCSVLSEQYSEQREFRLELTQATGEVLKKGLNLLGIEVLERM